MKKLLTLLITLAMLFTFSGSATVSASNDPFDLNDFGYRVVNTGGKGSLVFQTSPGGSFMSSYSFISGDYIWVNLYWRNSGYAIAYSNGTYGYVDANYINWNSSVSTSPSTYDPHSLSDFGYRTVRTGGRGNLVFQTSPGGSFMNNYSYKDGEIICVNLYWRKSGYALAYANGTYGYVDAGFIDWSATNSTPDASYDPHSLSDFEYRTVNTDGRGKLVFQNSPGGSFLKDYSYNNGDSIYVNLYWRENGYALAYADGTYGYVDASYINWGSSSSTIYDPHSLSYFGYRTVNTDGRGNLVFQNSPGGSFLNNYSYKNGDTIYVNLYWREKGYALAYSNGTYGYVDARYINW